MYLFDKNISLNTKLFENNSNWFFWMSIFIVLLFSVVVYLVHWKKKGMTSIFLSLIFGLVGLILLLSFNGLASEKSIQNSNFWISIPGTIFIWGISIMVPFYIFIIIIDLIISENIKKVKKKTFATSFLSLLGVQLFGIIVALLMIPLILVLPNSLFYVTIDGEIGSGTTNIIDEISKVISYFTKWWLILFMALLGVMMGVVINILKVRKPREVEKVKDILRGSLSSINKYFKNVIIIVPLVILTRILSLGLFRVNEAGIVLKFILAFLGLFWIGALIIFSTFFSLDIFLSSPNINRKEKVSILTNQLLTIYASQSSQAILFNTQTNVKRLGVSEEISSLTPTQGTMMGMVMCNGFGPMLVMLFIIANKNNGVIPISDVMIIIGVIMLMTMITIGHGSADYLIILTSISSLGYGFDFGKNIYISLLMPVNEFNERTIVKPNNTLGHIFATLITEKVHKKVSK